MPTCLQRIVTPRDTDPIDVRPLYLDEATTHCTIHDRRTLTIPPSATISFATYFNAFPASYWKRWTTIDDVILTMTATGTGRISVYRSNPDGDTFYLDSHALDSPDTPTPIAFTISLDRFEDGGWIWFEVFTTDTTLHITDAAWATDHQLRPHQLAIGMTTMRPDDCVTALEALAADPDVLAVVDTVFVVDQGRTKVRDHPRYPTAATALADRLQIIEQDNLGGSGGFARAMYEAITTTSADAITLMDDDIVLEPESLYRAAVFSAAAAHPIIVGSHMFDLYNRIRLLASAELVDLSTCQWRTAPGAVAGHNFTTHPLRTTPALHRRTDAGYNGWWTCTIPRTIINAVGLPLPLFIKWDDAEYGIRAAAAGHPTISLPGSAIWHMPWTDKNDTTDWQSYFHVRNRLITAALHSPDTVRNTIAASLYRLTVKHALAMQYSTAELTQLAIEDFLTGPTTLFPSLRTALPAIQAIRAEHTDTQLLTPTDAPTVIPGDPHPVRSPAHGILRAGRAVLHNLLPTRTPDQPAPAFAAHDAHWTTLGLLDTAVVSTGAGTVARRRDPALFRELITRAATNTARLLRHWPTITDAYRTALPDLTSLDAWHTALHKTDNDSHLYA